MCKIPLLSTSGEPAPATIEIDEKAPLKASNKFSANQQKIMRFGEIWRSHIAPTTLVFVLVLPMIIYNKECKFCSSIIHSFSVLFTRTILYLVFVTIIRLLHLLLRYVVCAYYGYYWMHNSIRRSSKSNSMFYVAHSFDVNTCIIRPLTLAMHIV